MRFWLLKIVCISLLAFASLPAHSQSEATLPKFLFQDTEGNAFSKKDIPAHTALLLVYFRTDCDECRHTAQLIQENAAQYPLMIWMVSPNDLETLGVFEYMTGLLRLNNVQVLQDNHDLMHKLFSFSALPFVVLFDSEGEQVKTYDFLPDAKTVIEDLAQK